MSTNAWHRLLIMIHPSGQIDLYVWSMTAYRPFLKDFPTLKLKKCLGNGAYFLNLSIYVAILSSHHNTTCIRVSYKVSKKL